MTGRGRKREVGRKRGSADGGAGGGGGGGCGWVRWSCVNDR